MRKLIDILNKVLGILVFITLVTLSGCQELQYKAN